MGVNPFHAFRPCFFLRIFWVSDWVEAPGLVVVLRERVVGPLLELVQPVFPSRERVKPVILSPRGVPGFDVRRYLFSPSGRHGFLQGFQALVNLILGDGGLLLPPTTFDQLG